MLLIVFWETSLNENLKQNNYLKNQFLEIK